MDSGSHVVTARSSTTWLGLWMVAFFAIVLTVSGCAGETDEGKAEAHTAEPHTANSLAKAARPNGTRPLPDLGLPPRPTNLAPGRYVTEEFEPPSPSAWARAGL